MCWIAMGITKCLYVLCMFTFSTILLIGTLVAVGNLLILGFAVFDS